MVVEVLCSQNQLSYKHKNTFNCKVYCRKWQSQAPCVSIVLLFLEFEIVWQKFCVWTLWFFSPALQKNNQLTLFWHKSKMYFSILWVYHKYTYFWKNQHNRKGIQKEQCVACSWLSSCFTSHVHFSNRKSFTKGHWVLSWWFRKNSTYPVFSSICC